MQILFHCSILQTSAIIHKLVHIKNSNYLQLKKLNHLMVESWMNSSHSSPLNLRRVEGLLGTNFFSIGHD